MPDYRGRKGSTEDLFPRDKRAWAREIWAEHDVTVHTRTADFSRNGGNPSNVLYVLVDDLSFGGMGIPKTNYARGSQTPRINDFADEGFSLMRKYTEPSRTPC